MTLRILQGKISGECFITDIDTLDYCGPVSCRELAEEQNLDSYNLDNTMNPSDLEQMVDVTSCYVTETEPRASR